MDNPYAQFDVPSTAQGASPVNPYAQFDTQTPSTTQTPATSQNPSILQRIGDVGKGVADGAINAYSGLVGAAQSGDNFIDSRLLGIGSHLPHVPILSNLAKGILAGDQAVNSVPVQSSVNAGENELIGQPQTTAGKIAEGLTQGGLGAVAVGAPLAAGAQRAIAAYGAADGAVSPILQNWGVSKDTADDIQAAGGLLPAAGSIARAGAGSASRALIARTGQSTMDDSQALAALNFDRSLQDIKNNPVNGNMTDFQAAKTLKADNDNTSKAFVKTLAATKDPSNPSQSAITPVEKGNMLSAAQTANSHLSSLANNPDGAFSQILPNDTGYTQEMHDALQNHLMQTDYSSGQGFLNNSVGPFSTLMQKFAPYAAMGSGAVALGSGNLTEGLGLISAGLGGTTHVGGNGLYKTGQFLDHIFGTALTPAQAKLAQAQLYAKNNGLKIPELSPAAQLQQQTGLLSETLQQQAERSKQEARNTILPSAGEPWNLVNPDPANPNMALYDTPTGGRGYFDSTLVHPSDGMRPVTDPNVLSSPLVTHPLDPASAPAQTSVQPPPPAQTNAPPSASAPPPPMPSATNDLPQGQQKPALPKIINVPDNGQNLSNFVYNDFRPGTGLPMQRENQAAIQALYNNGQILRSTATDYLSGAAIHRNLAHHVANQVSIARGLGPIIDDGAMDANAQLTPYQVQQINQTRAARLGTAEQNQAAIDTQNALNNAQ